MTKSISFSDVANLSAYLDNQLSQAEKTRLEKRMEEQPDLREILRDMQEAKILLRKTPRRRVPRNFTLTARMAGIKPPVPRLVPAFSWASAVAMLFFVITLGSNLAGKFSFGMAARIASAPAGYGMGGGPPAAEGPYPEEAAPADSSLEVTPTPEMMLMTLPEATSMPEEPVLEAEETSAKTPAPVSPWMFIWPGLAVTLIGTALSIRAINIHRFKKKAGKQKQE